MFLIQIQLAVYNIYSPDLSYSGFALSSWGYILSYVLQFAINEKYCLFVSLKNCKGYKAEMCYTHGKWVYVLFIPESGPRPHNF